MKKIAFLFAVILLACVGETFAQGVTTSSLGGKVTDNTGGPLPGANVIATHQPSGTTYGATTDFDGYYRISGMRTGGPYTVTISYVGFNDFKKENIYLQLGQAFRISTQMVESSTALDEVVIQASNTGVFNSNKTGAETNISQRDIQNLPQTSRSVADFVRLTPQAQVTEGNDGFSISLAGQNNRYNAIYIDGAVNNDVFGLAGSGTNGGQTGVNPFSVDAIESFQVQIAPFDVRIAGFAGGAISAVTRSGTNEIEGSAYAFVRNEDLAGKTPPILVNDGESREKFPEFTATTYGVRVGGPIIKDKLFYFVNYEREDREVPQPYNISNYNGNTNTLAAIEDLRTRTLATYGYDIGGFQNNITSLESDKLTIKVDWNINENNKLSFRHGYVKGDNLEARNSDNDAIGFLNGSERFVTETHSSALEINSSIGSDFSNNLIIGYTRVRDDRDPDGAAFPTVRIADGLNAFRFDEGLIFGNEPFSTANLLDQDIFTFTNNFEIYKGKHTITLGTHNEYSKIKNLFFAFNHGDYTFLTVDDFLNGQPVNFYQREYSLVGSGAVGDNSDGAAEFDLLQFGFYAQDEVQFTDNFKITAGLRFDIPIWEDGAVNNDFNNRTIPLLEAAGYDLQGARVGTGVDTQVYVSPRVGFNWDVNGARTTQIRGGFGIFTSRLPLVWPAATYNNNGITGGQTRSFDLSDPVIFNPNVNEQPVNVQPGTGGLGGSINLFTPDFKLPQLFKVNFAIDQKLPFWGLVASADFLWNDNINALYYQQLNIQGVAGTLVGPDNRPFYNDDEIDDTYGDIILASNTGEGNSWNASVTLRKPYDNGFQGQISYSYGDAESIFDGTSSRNISQWRGIETVNGKNAPQLSRSDFAQGHRINANMSYEIKWNDNIKTTIGVYYEGAQSQPYSFIYRGALLGDNRTDNALIYVPADASEINLVPFTDRDGIEVTPAQQWQQLNAFIEGNDYLRDRRGQYAERNGDQGPWSHVIDLRFVQDFSIKFGDKNHTLQATADINNFTNLLNKDWGKRKFIPGTVSLINVEQGGPNPEFTFDQSRVANGIEQITDTGRLNSSRWQMQVGLRYIFN
ncbi:carboxypeptidase regulatory-like domain-containing protein [Aquimarina sp. D1M17]|uniref:TonB-dependent receptor n=1 Tax=Aquimarina acroporae TaxID=2937283 RepID=UPI0020BF30FE|nr:TonB-dependent receptor [Aquimarina acroporae]MCK8524169.1 carboxypeptidase regulatory-like domain-containing protein [Aquimarina acroporae]